MLRPGATKDEVRIALGINVGSDAYDIAGAAYDFIGLFRTEFLYMENDHSKSRATNLKNLNAKSYICSEFLQRTYTD